MSTVCTCPVVSTTICFDAEVAHLRCPRCDTQVWTLAGRAVTADVAHTALRASFAAHRDDALLRTAHRVRVPSARPSVVDVRDLEAVNLQEALDAVLARKGLAGWALSA